MPLAVVVTAFGVNRAARTIGASRPSQLPPFFARNAPSPEPPGATSDMVLTHTAPIGGGAGREPRSGPGTARRFRLVRR